MSEPYRTETDPEWQAAIEAEQYCADVVRRAIQTIVTFAVPTKEWGGDVDCDWIEYKLKHALDEAFPQRVEQREYGYAGRRGDRPKMSISLRKRVMERDAYRCVYCGTHVDLQVDHVHPVSKGGSNDPDNLQTLCMPCNREKSNKVPD